MKKFLLLYSYSVPFYKGFTVEAETEEEAIKIAEKAVDDGRFDHVIADPAMDELDDPRIISCGAPEGLREGSYPTMEELIEKFSSEGGAR